MKPIFRVSFPTSTQCYSFFKSKKRWNLAGSSSSNRSPNGDANAWNTNRLDYKYDISEFLEKLKLIHVFSEMRLNEYEEEQVINWEFQGAEYFVHAKRAEEKNTLEKRVYALGDRWVLIFSVHGVVFRSCNSLHKFQFIDSAVYGEISLAQRNASLWFGNHAD